MENESKPNDKQAAGQDTQPAVDEKFVEIKAPQQEIPKQGTVTPPVVCNSSKTMHTASKAMKTPQGLNNAMFSLNMTAILLGIKENIELTVGTPLLFTIFFILLRIKIYLDDSKFLEDGKADDRPIKKWGYLTSIFTWLLFSFSAYRINTKPEWSFWFFIAAITMSTIWIAPIQLKLKFKERKHNIWLASNVIYVLGAFALLYLDKENNMARNFVFGGLFIMLFIDAIVSNPLEHFDS